MLFAALSFDGDVERPTRATFCISSTVQVGRGGKKRKEARILGTDGARSAEFDP